MGRGSRGVNGKLVGTGTRASKRNAGAEEVSLEDSGVDNIRLREKKAARHPDASILSLDFKPNAPRYIRQEGIFTFEGQSEPVSNEALDHASTLAASEIKRRLTETPGQAFGVEDIAKSVYSGLGGYYLVAADKDSDFYEFKDYEGLGENEKNRYRKTAEELLDKGINDLSIKYYAGEFLPEGFHPLRDQTVSEGVKLNSRRLRAEKEQANKLGYDDLNSVPTKHPHELVVSRAGNDVLNDREKKTLRKYLDLIRSQEKEGAALTALRIARNS